MLHSIWIVIALPLAGMLLNGLLGRHLGRTFVSIIGVGVVVVSSALGAWAIAELSALPEAERTFTVTLWDWIALSHLHVPLALRVDALSLWMVLVVSGVGFLIHLYSVGYMQHEDARMFARFFAYLNMFVASMLLLVLADNYLLLYVGWELVGACSYLLIGFWFHKRDEEQAPVALLDGTQVSLPPNLNPADSGKKAFIVNRIGDFGFALGVFLIWSTFGTLNFTEIFEAASRAPTAAITAITLLLFMGAVGKSAQLPLSVWLPDAMAGPTPVSALIHAATMVTAGVYIVARSHMLYSFAPTSALIVTLIGAITALYAATTALVQVDLKRILAYSTISQLGYMFVAVGVGAYAAGLFHLTTHAFFKALLFLAAGSVMHALHEVIDIRRMGGLRHKMPLTWLTFLAGALALAGFPLTSGFFSKDEILLKAFELSPWLWALGLLTALLTALYTFRALFVAFLGQPREWPLYEKAHESSGIMTLPLVVLAILALLGGVLGLPAIWGVPNLMVDWLAPVFTAHAPPTEQGLSVMTEWFLLGISAGVSLVGIALAYWFYVLRTDIPARLAVALRPAFVFLVNKCYLDDAYDAVFVRGGRQLAQLLAYDLDKAAIDGVIDGGARLFARGGAWLTQFEDGYTPHYALGMFVGALLLVVYLVLR
ncbi:MAG: NADH-quinone oxidoreductase subunit L [Anaerolineae bacterium]